MSAEEFRESAAPFKSTGDEAEEALQDASGLVLLLPHAAAEGVHGEGGKRSRKEWNCSNE